jgi:hypothetical protein
LRRRIPLTPVPTLTTLTVLLATICLVLALAWRREHEEAACWRAVAEDDRPPPEGDCHRPLKIGPVPVIP